MNWFRYTQGSGHKLEYPDSSEYLEGLHAPRETGARLKFRYLVDSRDTGEDRILPFSYLDMYPVHHRLFLHRLYGSAGGLLGAPMECIL